MEMRVETKVRANPNVGVRDLMTEKERELLFRDVYLCRLPFICGLRDRVDTQNSLGRTRDCERFSEMRRDVHRSRGISLADASVASRFSLLAV